MKELELTGLRGALHPRLTALLVHPEEGPPQASEIVGRQDPARLLAGPGGMMDSIEGTMRRRCPVGARPAPPGPTLRHFPQEARC